MYEDNLRPTNFFVLFSKHKKVMVLYKDFHNLPNPSLPKEGTQPLPRPLLSRRGM